MVIKNLDSELDPDPQLGKLLDPYSDPQPWNSQGKTWIYWPAVQNDLEEDPMLRQNVNIYKDNTKMPVDEDDEEGQSY